MHRTKPGSRNRRDFAIKMAEVGYRRVLTHDELCRRWRISRSQLTRLRNQGRVPFFTPPDTRRYLYPLDSITVLEKALDKGGDTEKADITPQHVNYIPKEV